MNLALQDIPDNHARQLAGWLLVVSLLVFIMVVIGGVTRLTGSGLSMVEWKPLTGFLPPLNEADWHRLFDQYRQYPEFLHVNRDMDLAGFKGIFWLEFIHRVFGRLIGIAFLLPFLYFAVRRMLPAVLTPKLVMMFILGGLQGLLGWYMVKSGLVDDPHVSQYRLTAHLMLATLIYGLLLWTALDLLRSRQQVIQAPHKGLGIATVLLILVAVTMTSGGFVAGLKAGLVYNTFPLMGDTLIAPGVYASHPWYLAALEDAVTVQFNHRLLAITTFILIVAFWWFGRSQWSGSRQALFWHLVLAAALLQVTLGVSTLLLRVPVAVAAAHQAGALLLLTSLLLLVHNLKYPPTATSR
jgi:cytochrome c oxidase assembly protein subunit 15